MAGVPPARYARLFYSDGRIARYADPRLAYAVWLGAPRGMRIAFRGPGDDTPVYPHDYAGQMRQPAILACHYGMALCKPDNQKHGILQ